MEIKKRASILALSVLTASAALLAGCGSSGSGDTGGSETAAKPADGSESAAASDKTIGIVMPSKSLERWNRDGTYLKEQFESLGYNVELKYSDNDAKQQNGDVEALIADNVSAIIIASVDGNALSQTLKSAEDANIPVVAYDRLIMNTDAVDYYVSFDNYQVGVLFGQFAIDSLKLDTEAGPFNIEYVSGDTADNNAVIFFNGMTDTLRPYVENGKLNFPSGKTSFEQTSTAGWSTDLALKNMQDTLASYYSDGTRLDAVIAHSDSLSLGVTQAVISDYAGSNYPIITGQDGDIAVLRNIVDDKQTMTVYKNVNDEAAVTVEVTKALLAGQTPGKELVDTLSAECVFDTESYDNGSKKVASYLLTPTIVTKDNLEELVKTGLYKWDDEHKYLLSATSE